MSAAQHHTGGGVGLDLATLSSPVTAPVSVRHDADTKERIVVDFKPGTDVLFVLLGAIMVLAMHGGFAFLELGTVRAKNQVNALVKILVDFCVSTLAYFFIGYTLAYGVNFLSGADVLAAGNGIGLVKFFFLLTFAAAVPAIVSGGIAERLRWDYSGGRLSRPWSLADLRSSEANRLSDRSGASRGSTVIRASAGSRSSQAVSSASNASSMRASPTNAMAR